MITGRKDFILKQCRDKQVLHLGCVDAGPFFYDRLAKGELLHQELSLVAKEVRGIDIDETGINLLKQQGLLNLEVGDVCDPDTLVSLGDKEYDILLATEIVEHLQNPGLFLSNIRQLMKPGNTRLIVSVPNAYRIDTLKNLLRGIEFIHPDHNYWFSYHTIVTLLIKCGYEIQEVYVYSFKSTQLLPRRTLQPVTAGGGIAVDGETLQAPLPSRSSARNVLSYIRALPMRILAAFLYSRTPFFGDGIIVVAGAAVDGN
jgi:SAM-dependent methyltransferase